MPYSEAQYVKDLEKGIDILSGQVMYLEQLLDAFLTGDMPEKCDFTIAVAAMRGRRYLEFERKRNLFREIGEDAYAS